MSGTRAITRIEPTLLSAPHGDHPRHLPTGYRSAGLVRIECSDGTTGLGESYLGVFAPEVFKALIEFYAPFAIGENPENMRLTEKLRRQSLWWGWAGASVSALSAIDIALWDIRGKLASCPVWALLSDRGVESICLYASGGTPTDPEELHREMDTYLAEGFQAIKIRIGPWRQDEVKKTALVRQIIGSEVRLMLDAVQSINQPPWTAEEAISVARKLEEFDPYWLEEPCGSYDLNGYATVRRCTSIPIAGGESLTSAKMFEHFFEARSFSIAQPDATHVGGISDCMDVCALAQRYHVPVALHSWGTAVCMAANYHVGFAISDCLILERPALENPLVSALLREPFRTKEGRLFPPSAPGLGVELAQDVCSRFPYRPGSAYQI